MITISDCDCGNRCRAGSDKCASCETAERKAAKQANKTKVVTQVQKITPKRAAENVQYLKLRREYLALYPVCEVPECNLKAVEIHHQRGRENDRLLDTNFFMAVCHAHHAEFTEHSREAIDKGFSKSRTV